MLRSACANSTREIGRAASASHSLKMEEPATAEPMSPASVVASPVRAQACVRQANPNPRGSAALFLAECWR